jgi:long-chain acyl-CoA synthetase
MGAVVRAGISNAGGAPGPTDLCGSLERASELHGEKQALTDGRGSITYAKLYTRTLGLAGAFAALDVPLGGRVGFLGVNSVAHAECVTGIPAAGRILVDLNFRLNEAELQFILDDCGVEVLIIDPAQLDVARRLRGACATLRELVYDGEGPTPADCLSYEELAVRGAGVITDQDPDSVAAISYTGGTTGVPKGVVLSHGNLLANTRHNLIATGHRREHRWLHVCPMFHVAGTANILACTWAGASQYVLPRFDAGAVIETIRTHEITHLLLVPTMIGMLLDELDREGTGQGLPSLRHLQYAASPISPTLQGKLLRALPCEIVQFYGMTEAAPTVSSLSAFAHRAGARGAEPWAARLSSVGRPVVGVETEVRRPDGHVLPPGVVGELWVRGANVMLGYWNRPEATASALDDGWYRTGDAARADSEGYLYLVDRLKDMIITGGENVYSMEVEAALTQHPGVLEAAVFGSPDSRWGEAVHAIVSSVPGTTVSSEELVAHCRTLLAGYKVPRSIDLAPEPLPKSGAGKVLKSRLREPYWAVHDRRVS